MDSPATHDIIAPESEQSLTELLSDFENQMTHAIIEAYGEEQPVSHINTLADQLSALANQGIAVGDEAYRQIEGQETKNLEAYLITYDWATRVKAFLVLWRDVLFQEHKALLQVSDGDIPMEHYQKLRLASRNTLFDASNELKEYLPNTVRRIVRPEKQMDTWYLQLNPWAVYRKQFEQFPTQAKSLNDQFNKLWNSSGAYVLINSRFTDTFKSYLDTLNQMEAEVNEIIEHITNEAEEVKMSVVDQLEEIDRKVLITSKLSRFTADLKEDLNELPAKMNIDVDISGSTLLYKSMNIRQSTNEWLESEVMSEVYEFFQISENIHNRLNLAIENIRTLIQNERLEDEPHPREDILQILQNLNKNLDKSSEQIGLLDRQVKKQLDKTLGASRVFQEDFLALSFQSTINQYRRYQVRWLEKLQGWVKRKGYFIREYRKNVKEEEIMSVSEKIVRVVKARTVQSENLHYTNIFMTKGYIGSSFWVGRTQELNHIQDQVENWRLGYRGAMLFTGSRFCGKTLLGRLVSQNYFGNKMIALRPEDRIYVEGRPYETSYNLGEALDFIIKYNNKDQFMIWIDDLELWSDDKLTMSENIRHLIKTIDQHSNHIFFMVSASNWLKEQMDEWFEIKKVFQTEINIDRMSVDEIQQAVLIRHSATHMQLVNENGEIFTSSELEKIINRLYRAAGGNVGEVLQRWAALMHKYNDESVSPHIAMSYKLPDFINPDIAVLLRAILTMRRTNEYRLRKIMGPAFQTIYQPILQRALHLGVIKRNTNGWLELNPMLANDVGALLAKSGFISFEGEKGYSENSFL